ncbi:MAG: hypothetical protein IJH04_10890 [Eggerthellaceae bacterium]|nr:hypothetical protein [Eggerthellaceae bacterium]
MSAIVQDDKGVYRWAFEFNLWRNPTILATVLKVFVIIVLAVGSINFLLLVPDLIGGTLYSWQVEGAFRWCGVMLAIMAVLCLIGYAVYATIMGGKYCAVFKMDEKGVEHRQLPKQFEKAQVIGALNVIAGLAGGKPSQVGAGILAASRDSSYSSFGAVTSIKGSRRLQVIKVNEPLMKNQVYVEPEDYDFVFDYIVAHCPNAKKVKG